MSFSIDVSGSSMSTTSAVHDLGQVVRRDVGGHADRDAGGAVDEQIRDARRAARPALDSRLVEVRREVDGVLVDVGEHLVRDLGQPRSRCTAWPPADRRRSSRSCPARPRAGSAARTPAPSARAPRRRASRRGGGYLPSTSPTTRAAFLYGAVAARPEVLHRVEHAAVHGLEAVADVGQGAPDDDGHRVVQVRLAHLLFDRDRNLALVRHRARCPGSPRRARAAR